MNNIRRAFIGAVAGLLLVLVGAYLRLNASALSVREIAPGPRAVFTDGEGRRVDDATVAKLRFRHEDSRRAAAFRDIGLVMLCCGGALIVAVTTGWMFVRTSKTDHGAPTA